MINICKTMVVATPSGTYRIDPSRPATECFEKLNDDFLNSSENLPVDLEIGSGVALGVGAGYIVGHPDGIVGISRFK